MKWVCNTVRLSIENRIGQYQYGPNLVRIFVLHWRSLLLTKSVHKHKQSYELKTLQEVVVHIRNEAPTNKCVML